MEDAEQIVRKLSIRDSELVRQALTEGEAGCNAASPLEPKTQALVQVASLIAINAAAPSYLEAIDTARSAGASDDELVACLLAVTPSIGAARVVSAAPKLGLALGYDVAAALEDSDPTLG